MAAHCASINIYNCPPDSPSPLFLLKRSLYLFQEDHLFQCYLPTPTWELGLIVASNLTRQLSLCTRSYTETLLSLSPFPPLLIWLSHLTQQFSCCLATTAGKPTPTSLNYPQTSPPFSFLCLLLLLGHSPSVLSCFPPLQCSHALAQPCVLLDLSLQQMACVSVCLCVCVNE